ncbi:hypothetical protein OAI70_01650 [Candidatus Pelagibacter sp.]|nr:hypothetical protein [Candidatus Pelagibacter sp.]
MNNPKIAIFISDVGFGHMVRQREIIKTIIEDIKGAEITVINKYQINILRENFGNKIKYIKKYNNIGLFTNDKSHLDYPKSLNELSSWNKNIKKDFLFFKNKFSNYDLIISDFVPEIFEFSNKFGIPCFGVCHFTWSWFFKKLVKNKPFKNKKIKKIIKELSLKEKMATKYFFPPLTPSGIFNNLEKNKIIEVPFITDKNKNFKVEKKNNKKIFLIMDNGKKTLSNLISNTIDYLESVSGCKFYIGAITLKKNDIKKIKKTYNAVPIFGLKNIYSYVKKVDFVIVRAGFNSISETLIYKKPSIFMNEKFNPEITGNIKIIRKLKIGSTMIDKDWGKNFKKRIYKFLSKEQKLIYNNLKSYKFKTNGAKEIVKFIKESYIND